MLDDLKIVLKNLQEECEKEMQFAESLFESGDRANGHFREGVGRGIKRSIDQVKKAIEYS